MSGQYVLDGKTPVPCEDLLTWGKWLQNAKAERVVAKSTINGAEVSTVFLGLDHRFNVGPPLLFETMVFGGPLDGEQDRYSTWEEAEAGHKAMCKRVRDAPIE